MIKVIPMKKLLFKVSVRFFLCQHKCEFIHICWSAVCVPAGRRLLWFVNVAHESLLCTKLVKVWLP